jgi:hypothetical protein
MTVMPMTITKAVHFVMTFFLLLSLSLLAEQVPTSRCREARQRCLTGPGRSGGK